MNRERALGQTLPRRCLPEFFISHFMGSISEVHKGKYKTLWLFKVRFNNRTTWQFYFTKRECAGTRVLIFQVASDQFLWQKGRISILVVWWFIGETWESARRLSTRIENMLWTGSGLVPLTHCNTLGSHP